jgi:hypothetical protein
VILTPEQLEELTARKRPSWQARELEHLHIPYQTRTDGTLIVWAEDARPNQEQAPQRRRPQLKFA